MKLKAMNGLPLLLIQSFFVLLWGSGSIAIVFALRYTDPFTLLFYRVVFAAGLMLLISWLTKAPWPKKWSTIRKTLITGLLAQFLYVTTFSYALYYHVVPTVMSIILALQPLLTAVIYSLLLKQKVMRTQYMGLVLGLIGVVITIAHNLSTRSMTVFSCALALTSLTALTVASIIQKSNSEMDLRTGSALQFSIAIIPLFLLNFILGTFKLPLAAIFVFSLSWLAVGVSVGSNLLYYLLLRHRSAVKVNSLFYLIPTVTAILCYCFFGQTIDIYIIIGIVLTLSGVLITQKSEEPTKAKNETAWGNRSIFKAWRNVSKGNL